MQISQEFHPQKMFAELLKMIFSSSQHLSYRSVRKIFAIQNKIQIHKKEDFLKIYDKAR